MNQYSKKRLEQIIISHKNLLLKKLKFNMFEIEVRTFWYPF